MMLIHNINNRIPMKFVTMKFLCGDEILIKIVASWRVVEESYIFIACMIEQCHENYVQHDLILPLSTLHQNPGTAQLTLKIMKIM